MTPRSGGACVVEALRAHGVTPAWCVPGESYLPVLDALYDVADDIELVTCRHESGAAFMAGAEARLTQRPGVVLVTRGPGAANAAIALHVARQASVPLVVGVGQVARANLGRDSFQELDHETFLRPLAKHVEQVMQADELPAALARAFAIAASGRPGPVALVWPEDVLGEETAAAPVMPLAVAPPEVNADALAPLVAALAAAERPLILAGGGNWSDAACADLAAFAGANAIPVLTAFRRQDVMDHAHACFGGYLGLGAHVAAAAFASAADCVLVLGARLDEPTTNAYTLFNDGAARTLVHVYPAAAEIGRNVPVDHALVADVRPCARALAAAGRVVSRDLDAWRLRVREAWCVARQPPASSARLDLGAVMTTLAERLDDDAIVTSDAGN
ncbi:MAG: thiamine pyrophosphate-binding protein, partial [Gammaproteobacteria bacterium]